MRALRRLPAMQRRAESLMTLTLTAYAPTVATAGGLEKTTLATQGPTPGKVQGTSGTGRDTITRTVVVANVARPVIEGGIQIPIAAPVPVGSEDPKKAWVYEVTDVPDPADPALLGRRYMVINVPAKNFATARRLDVVEL